MILRRPVEALALLFLCGCQTSGTLSPVNLSEPGWSVRQGQAVWQMPGQRPELAGDFVFALNADGRCFLEFAKVPFPMVRASSSEARWEIEFPPQKMFFAGGGSPPKRLAWLHVCRALAGKEVKPPWRFERMADGGWRLDNAKNREVVEGFLEP
jgi:hypothetical protein